MNEVLRQEKKYAINLSDGAVLRRRLGAVMHGDAHNGPQGYTIRSLYFDTPDDQDFHDKLDGLELRRTLRLREEAQRLCLGDYRPLLAHDDPFAAECYGLMHCRCYQPRAVVEYHRQAYVARENHIRITLDSRIIATESSFSLFSGQLPMYPVLDPFHMVLEVKYNGFLLSYIKDLLNLVERSELSVSKYCLARSVSLSMQG